MLSSRMFFGGSGQHSCLYPPTLSVLICWPSARIPRTSRGTALRLDLSTLNFKLLTSNYFGISTCARADPQLTHNEHLRSERSSSLLESTLTKYWGGGGTASRRTQAICLHRIRFVISQALTGVSTRAGSRKLRPRRSGPAATAMANTTMVKISNPARAQL